MKKTISFFCMALFLFSCQSKKNNSAATNEPGKKPDNPPPVIHYDTISSLADLNKEGMAVFAAPNGEYYKMSSSKALPEDTITVTDGESLDAVTAHVANPPCQGEVFDGSDRKASKINLATTDTTNYETLDAFINTLADDDAMGKTHAPAISTGATSKRVTEEKRNVHIKKAWIYSFKREGDEDYHVIIGSNANRRTAHFFNMEISGLPPAHNSSSASLKRARTDFESFFRIAGKCVSDYDKEFLDDPIRISVTGSPFFDKLHYSQKQVIGPAEARPTSYWEIHPVSAIQFLKRE